MGRAVNPLALPTMVRIHPSPPFAHVAQGEERILGKDEVTGSNPVVGFRIRYYRIVIFLEENKEDKKWQGKSLLELNPMLILEQ